MDPIWRFLPDHLVLRVLEFSNEIEQRVAFKILPRKLVLDKNLEFRSEIVYDHLTRTMWDFTGLTDPEVPYWITRKDIKFSQYRSSGLYVFNMGWEDYQMTMFSGQDQIGPSTCSNHLVTNKRVKFR
jgi:type II restriction/modification system DNA methylase subunit YeeA